jgi:hypothetical protein
VHDRRSSGSDAGTIAAGQSRDAGAGPMAPCLGGDCSLIWGLAMHGRLQKKSSRIESGHGMERDFPLITL